MIEPAWKDLRIEELEDASYEFQNPLIPQYLNFLIILIFSLNKQLPEVVTDDNTTDKTKEGKNKQQ